MRFLELCVGGVSVDLGTAAAGGVGDDGGGLATRLAEDAALGRSGLVSDALGLCLGTEVCDLLCQALGVTDEVDGNHALTEGQKQIGHVEVDGNELGRHEGQHTGEGDCQDIAQTPDEPGAKALQRVLLAESQQNQEDAQDQDADACVSVHEALADGVDPLQHVGDPAESQSQQAEGEVDDLDDGTVFHFFSSFVVGVCLQADKWIVYEFHTIV